MEMKVFGVCNEAVRRGEKRKKNPKECDDKG